MSENSQVNNWKIYWSFIDYASSYLMWLQLPYSSTFIQHHINFSECSVWHSEHSRHCGNLYLQHQLLLQRQNYQQVLPVCAKWSQWCLDCTAEQWLAGMPRCATLLYCTFEETLDSFIIFRFRMFFSYKPAARCSGVSIIATPEL